MTVIVEGKNYTQLSSCDSTSAGGTWNAGAVDGDQVKEGTYSLSATLKNVGVQSVIFTPTSPVNLVDKHLRIWLIGTQGGKMALVSGLQISIAGGNAVRGYWYLGGRESYAGGWINLAVDTSRPVDNGTKPASLTGIVTIGIHIANEVSTKNAVNTWWDNLTISDGLRCFDKNSEGGFGLEDIYDYEDQTASGGFGIIRKIGGVYFVNGEIELGDRVGSSGCEFTDTSKILVYENRPVSTGLYTLTVTGNSTTGTVVTFGQKSAGKGVAGCTILAETGSIPYKIIAQSGNISNCQFLGCSFVNASGTQLSGYLSGAIEVLNSSWIACDEVMPKDTYIQSCNFINAPGRGVQMWVTGHNIIGCNFIGCATGIEISGASGTYEAVLNAHVFAGCDTDLESSITNGIVTGNLTNSCNASTFFHSDGGTGVLINAKTLYIKVQDKNTNPISGARVRMSKLSDGVEIFKDYTSSDGEISKPYNYGGSPVSVAVGIRKSQIGETKYFPVDTFGTIGDAGFSLIYAMTEDTIA
jgi:hypothetical protein